METVINKVREKWMNLKEKKESPAFIGEIGFMAYYGIMVMTKTFGYVSHDLFFRVSFVFALLCLAVKVFTTRYTIRESVVLYVLLAVSALCWIRVGEKNVMFITLTLWGMKDIRFFDLIKNTLWIRLFGTMLMITLACIGVTDIQPRVEIDASGMEFIVYALGYHRTNTTFYIIFLLLVLLIYIYYDKLNLWHFAGSVLICYVAFRITYCRTGALVFIGMWGLILLDKITKKKKYYKVICFNMVGLFSVSLFATMFYQRSNPVWLQLNRLFTGRIEITNNYFKAFGITLFPKTNDIFGAMNYTIIDNFYMNLFIGSGAFVALAFLLIATLAQLKLYREGYCREILFFTVFAIYAMLEQSPFNPVLNPFILLVGTMLYRDFKVRKIACVMVKQKDDPVDVSGALNKRETIKTQGKLKVLQVHNGYQIPGGEDVVADNEMQLLKMHGHEVISYRRNNAELNEMGLWRKLLLPFTAVFSVKTYREVKRIIREENIDVVHVHNTMMLISPSVFYAAFRLHVPVVQTLHNFRMLCPAGSFYRGERICEDCAKKGLHCSLKHSCYRGSRSQTFVGAAILKIHRILGTYRRVNFICLTEFNKEKLSLLNQGGRKVIDFDKVYLKPNFTFDAAAHDKNLEEREYFLFVGRLEALKGIDVAVRAFAQLPKERLVVVGDGPLYGEIKEYITTHHIKNIELTGRLSRQEVQEKYKKARAVIVSSQCYETFGMAIAEAYSFGVPVIAGDIGNLSHMVEDMRTGLRFCYDSAANLAETVRLYTQLDGEEMRKNARRFYEEHFCTEDNYQALEQIYFDILERDGK